MRNCKDRLPLNGQQHWPLPHDSLHWEVGLAKGNVHLVVHRDAMPKLASLRFAYWDASLASCCSSMQIAHRAVSVALLLRSLHDTLTLAVVANTSGHSHYNADKSVRSLLRCARPQA